LTVVAVLDGAPAAGLPGTVAGVLADDGDASESAFAGTQAETAATTRIEPATDGQWKSGRRIMSRDKHFRSGVATR
jgi:hypothetical protein